MISGQDYDEEGIERFITSRFPKMSQHELQARIAMVSKSLEVGRTLEALKSMGTDATYVSCDVTDDNDVQRVFASIRARSRQIAGIVHGAGIAKDRLLGDMTADDFSEVVKVKVLGTWNLFRAVDRETLKFFVGLSSISVLGNPGQANYSAGNRCMSDLMRRLSEEHPEILFRCLTLPPIEGAGMAEHPEIRELLTLRGIDYLHVDELAELFFREICIPRPSDVVVTFGKSFTDDDFPLPSIAARFNDRCRAAHGRNSDIPEA